MTDRPRVVLIDLSSLFWTAWSVNAENGIREPRAVTLANVKRCIAESSDLVAIACDSGKSFRKEISPEYKAQREKQPEAAYGELDKTKERLRADGFLLWEASGFEADDVMATACKAALDRGHEVRVCTSDKDLLQLVGVRTDVLRTHIWEVWDSRKVTEKLLIDPTQVGDLLALTGDASDNIPGVEGIGKTRAASLLTQYESIDRIYAAIDEGKDVPHMAKLRAGREAAMLSRKLVALRFDVPIDFEAIYQERKPQPLNGEVGDMDEPAEEFKEASKQAEPATPEVIEREKTPAPVALIPVVEYERQLEPTSIGTAYKLAKGLADSRLYSRFLNPEAIMAVIIRGREMGLGALTSLDSFHVIENRPVPHAYLMIARAKADADCEYLYCEETTDERATWVTKNKRNPRETRLTYTLAQAKSSGLVIDAREKTDRDGKKYMSKPNQWVVRPAEMVRKTCGVQLARMEYPAAVMGLYCYEELGGDEA